MILSDFGCWFADRPQGSGCQERVGRPQENVQSCRFRTFTQRAGHGRRDVRTASQGQYPHHPSSIPTNHTPLDLK